MRSWTPRRPSASIKERLFPRTAALERELPDPINWRWLAPAMALCVAALIVLAKNPRSGLGELFEPVHVRRGCAVAQRPERDSTVHGAAVDVDAAELIGDPAGERTLARARGSIDRDDNSFRQIFMVRDTISGVRRDRIEGIDRG